jgi:hypothetical protein
MCRPTRCKHCGRTTWAGCGEHIAAVQASVPADQWCPGHPKSDTPARTGGFLSRLLRR